MSKMKALEEIFFDMYPDGFDDEEMKSIEKKHKLDKLSKMSQVMFTKEAFENQDILANFTKIINASTLVSRFEKPAFKNFVGSITQDEKVRLEKALFEYIHGDEELGFNEMVFVMQPYKVAKWPILTVLKAYLNLDGDIFIKPTTVKMILGYFEADFKYTSKPNYDFYKTYRAFINDIKSQASPGVKPNNPAFSGFLMMTIGK
ncbi:hypothetical protein EZV73_11520 [Acidaminobacter sp. JC074]|uniref:hypothetical protein n=1 Tax=Acidaminobacter sp. JC074 TaxID=2530199 RepID=UPI001F0EBB26|nr:hypothetical protein [Acidaminobacter sp. JC074]MCH4888207.1 hypothetical protein [Acidaminobacter sp. JC074]